MISEMRSDSRFRDVLPAFNPIDVLEYCNPVTDELLGKAEPDDILAMKDIGAELDYIVEAARHLERRWNALTPCWERMPGGEWQPALTSRVAMYRRGLCALVPDDATGNVFDYLRTLIVPMGHYITHISPNELCGRGLVDTEKLQLMSFLKEQGVFCGMALKLDEAVVKDSLEDYLDVDMAFLGLGREFNFYRRPNFGTLRGLLEHPYLDGLSDLYTAADPDLMKRIFLDMHDRLGQYGLYLRSRCSEVQVELADTH